MSYDWEEDEQSLGRVSRFQSWLGRRVRNSLRYFFVAAALLAAWNFLAPFADLPMWAPYMDVLPSIVGPTESEMAIVNATHVIVMLVAAAIGMRV